MPIKQLCEHCGIEFVAPRASWTLCPTCHNAPSPIPVAAGPVANLDCPDCHGTGWLEFEKEHFGRRYDYAERCPCVTTATAEHPKDCSCSKCYYRSAEPFRSAGLHRHGCPCTYCQADGGRRQMTDTDDLTDRETALARITLLRDQLDRMILAPALPAYDLHPETAQSLAADPGPDGNFGAHPDIARQHSAWALMNMRKARARFGRS